MLSIDPLIKTSIVGRFIPDYTRKETDMGNFCGMVRLDLQKAFDTVDHQILLPKLKALVFNGLILIALYLRLQKSTVGWHREVS